jgi:TRAP-type C4-dicarboxylate transport system permease small subunit
MAQYGTLLLGTTAVGFVGAVFAASTGEDLQERFTNAGQTISPTLRRHVDMGDAAQSVAGLFFLMVLLWVGFAWWRRRVGEEKATVTVRKPKVLAALLMVLALGAGVAATTVITIAGHNGAKSVWEQKTP